MEDESVLHGSLRVGIVTWNVGNYQMLHDLTPFCPAGAPDHDIFAFGAQECEYSVKINPEEAAVCVDGPTNGYMSEDPGGSWHHWWACIQTHLGDEWAPVDSESLLEMRLIVFARCCLRPAITEIEHAFEATGLLGVVGNKGGIAIRFRCHDTSLCFISTHLAAHEGQKYREQRNSNVEEVPRRPLTFWGPLSALVCPQRCRCWRAGLELGMRIAMGSNSWTS